MVQRMSMFNQLTFPNLWGSLSRLEGHDLPLHPVERLYMGRRLYMLDASVGSTGDWVQRLNPQHRPKELHYRGAAEPQLHTDHQMVLAVLRRFGTTCNRRYRRGITGWPIQRNTVIPHPEREASFDTLKGEVDRTPRPTALWASMISEELWRLADRQEALQRMARLSAQEVIHSRRYLQKYLQSNIRRWFQQAGADEGTLMESGQVKETWDRIFRCYHQAKRQKPPPVKGGTEPGVGR